MLRKLYVWIVEPRICALFQRNLAVIDEENRQHLIMLNFLGSALMTTVYLMTFFAPYMRVMRETYTPYMALYLLNMIGALTVAKKSRIWLYICALTITLTTMTFGIDLGVFCNPHGNAVLFMAFLIAVPLMFIERPLLINFVTAVVCVVFSVITVAVKEPAVYQTDLTDCWVCFCISTVTARAMIKVRMSNIEARRQLYNESITDPLTGLANRRSLNAFMRQLRPGLLSAKTRAVVFLIDIDHFKLYNDTYGHLSGDECLISLSKNLSKLADREGLWLFRFGGEEFVAVSIKRDADADALGKSLVKSVCDMNMPFKKSAVGRLSVSVGGCDSSLFPTRSDVDLLNFADIALYKVKAQGRNGYMPYHEESAPEIPC